MITGQVPTNPIINPIVEFPNVVMNHIFNHIQYDEYHERKYEHMNRFRLKIFLKYQSKPYVCMYVTMKKNIFLLFDAC